MNPGSIITGEILLASLACGDIHLLENKLHRIYHLFWATGVEYSLGIIIEHLPDHIGIDSADPAFPGRSRAGQGINDRKLLIFRLEGFEFAIKGNIVLLPVGVKQDDISRKAHVCAVFYHASQRRYAYSPGEHGDLLVLPAKGEAAIGSGKTDRISLFQGKEGIGELVAGQPFGDKQKILSWATREAEGLCDFTLQPLEL